MTKALRIKAAVTFLTPDDGGRSMGACDYPSYRPHLVVGDPERRFAIVNDRGRGVEAYLGVHFTGSGQPLPPGVEHMVELSLMYPGVDYSALVAGATFTIREGGEIVGFGRVLL